ncbi:hypothetical protein CHU98_g2256 [Xylaria longipes]|nr:hypothetical protein CHU98_g2256 [Xylaria longipes]
MKASSRSTWRTDTSSAVTLPDFVGIVIKLLNLDALNHWRQRLHGGCLSAAMQWAPVCQAIRGVRTSTAETNPRRPTSVAGQGRTRLYGGEGSDLTLVKEPGKRSKQSSIFARHLLPTAKTTNAHLHNRRMHERLQFDIL